MSKNIFPEFPKKDFRVRIRHFPNGIMDECGRNDKYTTECAIFSTKDLITPIFKVYSKCNKADVPRRKIGFRVAYEKAVKIGQAIGII